MNRFDTGLFLRGGILLCLLITMVIAARLRTSPLIRSHPRLNYPYVIDPDSARFVRQAKIILDTGALPEVDPMRWQPIGRRSAEQLTLHSYLLAHLYRIVRKIWQRCSLELFAAISPVLISISCWLVLYLVIKELLGSSVALLSLNIVVVMPLMVARTVAGYADRDALSLLLGVGMYYFYLRACHHPSTVRFIYQLISGSIGGVLALTWHGVGLFVIVLICAEWVRFIFIGYRRADFIAYVIWLIPYLLCLSLKKSVYFPFTTSFSLIAVGVPLLFLVVIAIYFAISSSNRLAALSSLYGRISIGTSISLVCMVGVSLCAIWFFAHRTHGGLDPLSTITALLQPFGTSRLAQTILELQPQNVATYAVWPGIFFLAIIAGTSLIVYRLANHLGIDPWWSVIFLQLVIGGITYTELIPKQFTSAAKWGESIYGFCLLALPIGVLFSSIFSWKQRKFRNGVSQSGPVTLDGNALFLLCWLLLTLLCARGGIRFHFFFIPVAVPIGVYALATLLRSLFGNRYTIVWTGLVMGLILSELWAMRELPM